ncbi:MAG TPA: sulfite exporter TauE/SafE family protein [Thermoleophilaceae bacterium]|jgi:hypothetical protein
MVVAVVASIALAGACVQATTGMGFALILTPVAFAFLSPVNAIITVTALGLELNLLVLLGERRRPKVAWRELAPVVAAVVPGTVCGVLALRALPKPALQIAVGVTVLAAVALRVRAAGRAASAGPGSTHARLALGFATGALTTSAGVSGPPLALWFSRRGLPAAEVRDSLTAMFLVVGLIAGVALLPELGHAHLNAALLAAALCCVVGGHALGSRAFRRLGSRSFEPLLLAMILVAGVASIAVGAGAL